MERYSCSNGMEGVEIGDNILLGFSPCSVRGWSSNYRAQHSVHLTLRIWRNFQAFFYALSLSIRTAFRRPSQRK